MIINKFNFNVLNKIVFKCSFKSYNLILIFLSFNPNIYFLNSFWNIRYNWIDFSSNNLNVNFITLKSNGIRVSFIKDIDYTDLNDVVIFKRKASMFKKNSDNKYIILNKIYSNKENFNKNLFKNFNSSRINKEFNLPTFFKNFDLSRNFKPSIKFNRKIIKEFYNLKYSRNFSLTKNLKKYNNLDKKNLIVSLENRLFLVLMRSDFFFNYNDCIWFIKNKLVSVNSDIILNYNHILKPFDIINVSHSNYYYNFYQHTLDSILKKISKINQKVWLVNNLKYKNKDEDVKYPNWIENFKYFKKDIPINYEIDYISMTIIVLNYNFNYKYLDFYNYKFINLYLNRLYNWKFVN